MSETTPLTRGFIAGLGVGQIVSWGTLYYSFPLLAERMGQDLGWGKSEVYAAATVGLLVAGAAAYPIGVAIDRGHGRAIMSLGSALAGMLLLAWSQVTSLWLLYPLCAGIGVAQAMTLYEPAFAVVARRFGPEARRGITALTLWGGFASTVFVPLIEALIHWVDWRDTLVILGLLNGLIGVSLHAGLIPSRKAQGSGDSRVPSTQRSHLRGVIAGVLRQRVFWALLIAFTAYAAAFSGLSYHLFPLLLERGFSSATAVAGMAVIGPAQVLGRIALWRFADRAPIRTIGRVVVWAFPLTLLVWMSLPSEWWSLVAFAALYGAANGVMTIVRGVAVPEMVTRDAYGAVNGILGIPGTIARSFAPLAVALIWDRVRLYQPILVVLLMVYVVVGVGFWLASTTQNPSPIPVPSSSEG